MSVTVHIILVIIGFVSIYPFWNAAVISFNNGIDALKGGITFWPREFTLDNYRFVFKDKRLISGFIISVLRTGIGTAGAILCTSIFAYGMSKKELIGRKIYMGMAVFTMYFSGGLIPSYLLIRDLGLVNSFWVMVIPGLISTWNMIVFRTFFKSLPPGLEESAKIDGCTNWGVFFRIVFPLSGPVLATIALFTAVYHWNDWFAPGLYISNPDLLPIQTKLQQIMNSNIMTEQLKQMDSAAAAHLGSLRSVTSKSLTMATMMVATVPILLVYPFLQKYFVKGVMIGSIKE
ncbi:MAG: carbohydrate ABC transporter permease [Caldicoprobacterales bacterium]